MHLLFPSFLQLDKSLARHLVKNRVLFVFLQLPNLRCFCYQRKLPLNLSKLTNIYHTVCNENETYMPQLHLATAQTFESLLHSKLILH